MSLQLLTSAERLITDVDPVIINLCEQLGIETYWIICVSYIHMIML